MKRGFLAWSGYGAVSLFVLIFVVGPVALVLGGGLDPAYLGEVLRHPLYRQGFLNAFLVDLKEGTPPFADIGTRPYQK